MSMRRIQCALSPAPARRMPTMSARGTGGISAKVPSDRCRSVCANPLPYTSTRTTKNRVTNVLDTTSSREAAAASAADADDTEGAPVCAVVRPNALATVTSVGDFFAASCRTNHRAVSRGVESSPAISHENGNRKVCVPPARIEPAMNTAWCATMSPLPSRGYCASTLARSSTMYPKNSQLARSIWSMLPNSASLVLWLM
mmetsp:Transcript_41863/g.67256  ORF Transcript_41863/g.67256 Transcript_41863/m.67256 type:complete len:200 (+) Transcript_41863:1262-1861(+)